MFKHSLIKRSLVAGLVTGAASFPSVAQARYLEDPPLAPVASSPTSVQQTGSSAQSGFRWGDAGIGAAGTIVLLGAGAGAAGAMRRRRVHGTVTR